MMTAQEARRQSLRDQLRAVRRLQAAELYAAIVARIQVERLDAEARRLKKQIRELG
jgi:hypothetical protein